MFHLSWKTISEEAHFLVDWQFARALLCQKQNEEQNHIILNNSSAKFFFSEKKRKILDKTNVN